MNQHLFIMSQSQFTMNQHHHIMLQSLFTHLLQHTMNQHHIILQHQHTMNQLLTILKHQLTMNQHLTTTHTMRNIMILITMSMEYLVFPARTTHVWLRPPIPSLAAPRSLTDPECMLIQTPDARHTEYVMMEEMAPQGLGLSVLMVPCLTSISLLVSFGTRLTAARLFPCMN